MNEADLISRLNWFYSLEAAQVDNYSAQSKIVEDKYTSLALARFACIEQTHVENMAKHIRELGHEPTASRDAISSSIGKLIGSVTPTTGLANMLKLNVTLEQKAKSDYKKLIDEVTDKELLQTLWANFVDEDLHTAWMIKKINYLVMENELRQLRLTNKTHCAEDEPKVKD